MAGSIRSSWAGLLWAKREFYAPVRHASFRRALGIFLGPLAAGILIGWGLVSAFPGTLQTGAVGHLTYAASRVLGGVIRSGSGTIGHAPGWVNLLLGLFGAIAVLAGFATLMSSQRAEARLPVESERRIRVLLADYGSRDSLGYFATRRDKDAIFSESGKAAVTYRVVNGASLASADPIGDAEAWGPAIVAWLDQARAYAWVPAVMGASEDGARAYQRAGLRVIELGDEAILRPDSFTLEGREMRPVRQAVHRLDRAGYTVKVSRHKDLSESEMAGAVHDANAWRDTESERGFSMALGRLGDPSDGDCVLVEAFDGNHARTALLSLVAFGTELGTAYSELIDPVEQRARLTEQSLLAAGGDPEAMELDEDFLTAIEYAMPPTGGLGIGVDRLVMLLTGHNIRETLPFPMVRPTAGAK